MPGRGKAPIKRVNDGNFHEINELSGASKKSRSRPGKSVATTKSLGQQKIPEQRNKQMLNPVSSRKSKVARKINFGSKDAGNKNSKSTNNNAKPLNVRSKRSLSTARSDPSVVDHDISDGVEVDVNPSEDDFGSEEESDEEVDEIDAEKAKQSSQQSTGESSLAPNYHNLMEEDGFRKAFDKMMNEKLAKAKQEWLEES